MNVFFTAHLRGIFEYLVILNLTHNHDVQLQPAIYPLAKSER